VEHRQLGRTGLRVSVFGMGCGNFGGIGSAPEFYGQGESETEAFALLDEAAELGINFLDTADAYGGGRSESTIGAWLRAKDASTRDRMLISSKVANPVGDDPNQRGLSRRHILRQIDASLGRLGVDHLDMYLVHEPDPTTPLEETLEVLDSLVRAGKVRYLGVSNFSAWLTTRALWISDAQQLHRFDWVQNSFNLIDHQEQNDMVELCRGQGLGFTPFGPLCGGWLTGKYSLEREYPEGSRMTLRPEPYLRFRSAATFSAIDELAQMASDIGISTAGLALTWLLQHPDVTAPIVGPRRPAHFEPMREALETSLTPHQWSEIGALFADRDSAAPHSADPHSTG
jgi:aryl-alcohol dehydrogenase-like predicted oxidoreductase